MISFKYVWIHLHLGSRWYVLVCACCRAWESNIAMAGQQKKIKSSAVPEANTEHSEDPEAAKKDETAIAEAVTNEKTQIPEAATEHSESSKATKEDKTAVPEPACEERKRSLPAFLPGQSIIQWWASWFKNADEPPKKYSKKKRPAWFSGEVLTYNGYKAIKYAGIQQVAQHCYVTY